MKKERTFFAIQLRKLMAERNLTQEDLGSLININRQMISRWISNRAKPSLNSIKKISDALNVPINYFIEDGNTEKNKNSDDLNIRMNFLEEKNKALEEKVKRLETEIELIKIKTDKKL